MNKVKMSMQVMRGWATRHASWMGLKNFYAITRYNRSVMYAMAVHQLSDMLVQARGNK